MTQSLDGGGEGGLDILLLSRLTSLLSHLGERRFAWRQKII